MFFWKCRESNLEQLGEKFERYLSAMLPPTSHTYLLIQSDFLHFPIHAVGY